MLLLDLPNEILVHTLTPFDTKDLLHLTLVSTQVHDIVLRILHYRLLLAAAAPEYKLILDAYHPSRRGIRPYLFCTYLGTDGLSSKHEGQGSLYEDCAGVAGRLGKLGGLYSRFRPEHPDLAGSMPARRIAGATPVLSQPAGTFDTSGSNATGADASSGWSQTAGPTTAIWGNQGDGGLKKIIHSINLDGGELFGQFCAYANLVRLSPRRGVFLSNINVVEPNQGNMRLWRHWLMNLIQSGVAQQDALTALEPVSSNKCPDWAQDQTILWTDDKKNVGLRVAVRENCPPSLAPGVDRDDEPLSCDVEIQEMIIRTTHLMLAVEKSQAEQGMTGTGRTLIFGNFATVRLAPGYS